MTFPNTTLLDNFNRADGYSSKWPVLDIDNFVGRLIVSSNQATAPGGSFHGSFAGYFQPGYFGADQEAYFKIGTFPNSYTVNLYLRLNNPDNAATTSGYVFNFSFLYDVINGYSLDLDLSEITAGIKTSIYTHSVTNANDIPRPGDYYGVSAVGTRLSFWTSTALNGAWTEIAFTTNSAHTGAGYSGLLIQGTTSSDTFLVDDYSGGTVLTAGAARAYTGPLDTLALTQNPVTVKIDANVSVAQQSLSFALNSPTVRVDTTVALAAALALTFTEQPVSVRIDSSPLLNALALAFTEQAAGVAGDANVALNALALTLALRAVAVRVDSNVLLAAQELDFTLLPVTVDADRYFMLGSRGLISATTSKAHSSVTGSKAVITVGD